ncbi:MAG: hypothetical protein LBU90_01765 [Bacteroidales bacterium]|jgi:hypothetical protein|nr:hypothetical protein [Bacteroidales bacterium]
MNTDAPSLEDLQTMFEANPQRFNVIEEPIDMDLQINYLKRSKRLRKQQHSLEDVLAKLPLLYDEHTRLEEKRDIIIVLAGFDQVEAFRALEAYKNVAQGDIKPYIALAYQESKIALESSLLGEKLTFISSGLGGKGTKLRFFICLFHVEQKPYSAVQQKILRDELSYVFSQHNAECESIEFSGSFAKISALLPFTAEAHALVGKVAQECNNQHDTFIEQDFILTNVHSLDDEEIEHYWKSRDFEDSFVDFDFSDFDFDDDDDDDEE